MTNPNPNGANMEHDPKTGMPIIPLRESTADIEPVNTRASVLREAENLVNGDRNAQYGNPNQDFARTAEFWNTYMHGVLERKLNSEWSGQFNTGDPDLSEAMADAALNAIRCLLDPHDVAWMMALLKCSRSTVSPRKRDHYVDGAGYISCGADCACGGA